MFDIDSYALRWNHNLYMHVQQSWVSLLYGPWREKTCLRCLGTTKAQTSLRGFIRAVWSAPLLFTYWKLSYLDMLQANSNFIASLCSWGDWFESRFVGNPEVRFCRNEAHLVWTIINFYTLCVASSEGSVPTAQINGPKGNDKKQHCLHRPLCHFLSVLPQNNRKLQ